MSRAVEVCICSGMSNIAGYVEWSGCFASVALGSTHSVPSEGINESSCIYCVELSRKVVDVSDTSGTGVEIVVLV